eukprot:135038-Chlamydomonas_euryale.AAC.2
MLYKPTKPGQRIHEARPPLAITTDPSLSLWRRIAEHAALLRPAKHRHTARQGDGRLLYKSSSGPTLDEREHRGVENTSHGCSNARYT